SRASRVSERCCDGPTTAQIRSQTSWWRLEIASISAENNHVMNRAPATAALGGRPCSALLLVALACLPSVAKAQKLAQNSLFSATPSTGLISPIPPTRTHLRRPHPPLRRGQSAVTGGAPRSSALAGAESN